MTRKERRQVEVFALVAEAIERAVGYRPTGAHLGIALAVCDWPTESARLLRSLPSDQDRSLVDVLVAFYHVGLMAGVHVVFPDQEHAEREAALYRAVAEELDALWQVELLIFRVEQVPERLRGPTPGCAHPNHPSPRNCSSS